MEARSIWKKLTIDNKRISTSEEIRDLARKLDKDPWRSLKYLQSQGYIVRILKGVFYVRSPKEREIGGVDPSIYDLVGMAMEVKDVKRWFFGLDSALKLNNMTHEFFNIEYVITDSFRTTKVIKIIDTNFKFIKRNEKCFKFGIVTSGNYRYSDPEKTVLDMAYERYLESKESSYFTEPIIEYYNIIDIEIIRSYIDNYSDNFKRLLEGYI